MIFIVYFLLTCIALLCIEYYIAIVGYAGFGLAFSKFWLALAVIDIIAIILIYIIRKKKIIIPTSLKVFIGMALIIFITSFLMIEGNIIAAANKKVDTKLDYVIILGARVRGTIPSEILSDRLDCAVEYLKKNKSTKVVVSGGQGPGEDITEAEAMKKYLQDKGIGSKRIIMEDKSTNTYENIKNSLEIINSKTNKEYKLGIITSNFHVYRATEIAKKLGVDDVVGIPAKVNRLLTVNYYVREYFAVINEWVKGY